MNMKNHFWKIWWICIIFPKIKSNAILSHLHHPNPIGSVLSSMMTIMLYFGPLVWQSSTSYFLMILWHTWAHEPAQPWFMLQLELFCPPARLLLWGAGWSRGKGHFQGDCSQLKPSVLFIYRPIALKALFEEFWIYLSKQTSNSLHEKEGDNSSSYLSPPFDLHHALTTFLSALQAKTL